MMGCSALCKRADDESKYYSQTNTPSSQNPASVFVPEDKPNSVKSSRPGIKNQFFLPQDLQHLQARIDFFCSLLPLLCICNARTFQLTRWIRKNVMGAGASAGQGSSSAAAEAQQQQHQELRCRTASVSASASRPVNISSSADLRRPSHGSVISAASSSAAEGQFPGMPSSCKSTIFVYSPPPSLFLLDRRQNLLENQLDMPNAVASPHSPRMTAPVTCPALLSSTVLPRPTVWSVSAHASTHPSPDSIPPFLHIPSIHLHMSIQFNPIQSNPICIVADHATCSLC
jgi:hypothetical protein